MKILLAIALFLASLCTAHAQTPTCAPPQINGNQGVLFCTNWPSGYPSNVAGNATYDLAYSQLIPATYGSTPNVSITSAAIYIFGVQSFNGGSAFLKIERPNGDETLAWTFLVRVMDGEMGRQQNHVPGIRMTHLDILCFQAFWQAYASGPAGFGSNGTTRFFNVQVVYTIEP